MLGLGRCVSEVSPTQTKTSSRGESIQTKTRPRLEISKKNHNKTDQTTKKKAITTSAWSWPRPLRTGFKPVEGPTKQRSRTEGPYSAKAGGDEDPTALLQRSSHIVHFYQR